MGSLSMTRSGRHAPILSFLLRVTVLLLPACLLLLGVMRTTGRAQGLLLLGAAFQLIVCTLAFVSGSSWRQPAAAFLITLYMIALGWLWLGVSGLRDWYPHFAQALLLVVPLTVFAGQTLTNSGALALRRASLLAQRLASRRDWPANLSTCRNLPEVKALREALYLDATPALELLDHGTLSVRVAALAALEFRKNWRAGQAELVLEVAFKSSEPTVRAAAVGALANLDDRILIERLAGLLQDPSWEVRRATAEALLWNTEHRWNWIRQAVRQALADPRHEQDGPLQSTSQLLTPEALADLNAWASEKGLLGIRAAQMLARQYNLALQEQQDSGLLGRLYERLVDPHAPAALRIELAQLMRQHGQWDEALQEKLLEPANPAALRLMAAEALFADGKQAKALATLYDVARLPNREIALATADLAQRYLGIDFGLPAGQPLPALQSRQAAEVTRRVMVWAAQQEPAPVTG
jgi:hypothetical protein